MSKVWRIITTIVMICLLLAVVCFTVGIMTGADFSRIYQSINSRYMLTEYLDWARLAIGEIAGAFAG